MDERARNPKLVCVSLGVRWATPEKASLTVFCPGRYCSQLLCSSLRTLVPGWGGDESALTVAPHSPPSSSDPPSAVQGRAPLQRSPRRNHILLSLQTRTHVCPVCPGDGSGIPTPLAISVDLGGRGGSLGEEPPRPPWAPAGLAKNHGSAIFILRNNSAEMSSDMTRHKI